MTSGKLIMTIYQNLAVEYISVTNSHIAINHAIINCHLGHKTRQADL